MTTADKREKLHHFIDSADDQDVKALYNKIEGYIVGKPDGSDSPKMDKMDVMKQASNDPLFLADLKEIREDFSR